MGIFSSIILIRPKCRIYAAASTESRKCEFFLNMHIIQRMKTKIKCHTSIEYMQKFQHKKNDALHFGKLLLHILLNTKTIFSHAVTCRMKYHSLCVFFFLIWNGHNDSNTQEIMHIKNKNICRKLYEIYSRICHSKMFIVHFVCRTLLHFVCSNSTHYTKKHDMYNHMEGKKI